MGRQMDSPEQVARCLNCALPNCTGHCQYVRGERTTNRGREGRLYEYMGQKKPLSEWEKWLGVGRGVLYMRLRAGHSFEEAMRMGLGRKRIR